ncbi:MAG: M50 family metallopeptidase [Patescibacteria group bacterium]|nr:M50 family metallopeptidase [Patescibacteria group bacterium]
MTTVIFLLILTVLVLVHEFGHFFAAKKNGVAVEEFGFGYPPRIFGLKIGETIYSLNLIPLGGFVKLYGEEYYEINEKTSGKKNQKLLKKAFVFKKPWQKALIIVGGIIGNFLLGWLLISYLFTQGVPTPTNKVIIEKVQEKTPAALAGLKTGDVILKIISPTFYSFTATDQLISLTKKFAGEKITLLIQRENRQLTISLIPRKNPPVGQGPLGVVISSFEEKKYPWYQAPFYGLVQAYQITKKIIIELIKILVQFFSFKKPAVEVAGPIGIAHLTSQVVKFGQNAVLELMALLSLNLAVVNLLPFPALDGGRLIFVIYEWITKKKVNRHFERYLNLIGFLFLIGLAIAVSINDIIKIYK